MKHIGFKAASLLVSLLIGSMLFAGCTSKQASSGSAAAEEKTASAAKIRTTSTNIVKSKDGNPKKILVAYFSYADNTDAAHVTSTRYDAVTSASLTKTGDTLVGNNALIADAIVKKTGADLLALKTKTAYSPDYDKVVEEARDDIPKGVVPELQNGKVAAGDYDTIIIVYPIWWYKMAPAVTAFLKENNFSGKDIYAFASSGGSGFGDTIDDLKALQPNARIHQGIAIRQGDAASAEGPVGDALAKAGLTK